ncbi:MAG: hypothetical protein LBB36_05365 [Fibromonadaceae bacterium]|jgi:hypothetical protein|nr:hypothetical protein [Fibromonadaceae bacterium]
MDIVFSNRAKETAQAMRTFAERSLAEAKRQNTTVKLELVGNDMVATIGGKEIRQPLSSGFSLDISFGSPVTFVGDSWENKVTSVLLIGVSGITEEGYFVACGARGYCGAAVKTKSKNSFTAYVRRGKPSWEEL